MTRRPLKSSADETSCTLPSRKTLKFVLGMEDPSRLDGMVWLQVVNGMIRKLTDKSMACDPPIRGIKRQSLGFRLGDASWAVMLGGLYAPAMPTLYVVRHGHVHPSPTD